MLFRHVILVADIKENSEQLLFYQFQFLLYFHIY